MAHKRQKAIKTILFVIFLLILSIEKMLAYFRQTPCFATLSKNRAFPNLNCFHKTKPGRWKEDKL
jgi:hypothetical protein